MGQYLGHLMRRADSFEKTLIGERLRAGGEEDDRGWDGWMSSPTQWTWVWVNSRRWWWTGRPGVLWFMGLQRVGHNWATELNWTLQCILLAFFWEDNFFHTEEYFTYVTNKIWLRINDWLNSDIKTLWRWWNLSQTCKVQDTQHLGGEEFRNQQQWIKVETGWKEKSEKMNNEF